MRSAKSTNGLTEERPACRDRESVWSAHRKREETNTTVHIHCIHHAQHCITSQHITCKKMSTNLRDTVTTRIDTTVKIAAFDQFTTFYIPWSPHIRYSSCIRNKNCHRNLRI